MNMAKIGLPKGSGKRLKVREKSVKSQGILKWILSGNPEVTVIQNAPRGAFCNMLQGEHSAMLLTFIKLPFVNKIFVLSILVAVLHRCYGSSVAQW